jgi:hypothetical protein
MGVPTGTPPEASPTAIATASPTAALSPTITPSPKASLSAASPTGAASVTPTLTGGIEHSDPLFILRDASFGVTGEVAIPIRNVGADWVRIRATKSRYAIYAHDGTVLIDEPFTWSYPSDLGPGDHGYLATQVTFRHGKAADVDHIVVELSTKPVDKADTVTLTVADLRITDDPKVWGTDGVFTTGTVTNPTRKVLRGFDVGAFYFDARGAFLGYSSLNPGILRAHETLEFWTLPMVEGLERSAIATMEVFPASWCDCPG